ncbi:MAG: trypsin-like peptidase domain-containing protein [Gemmatimonadales bacterium]
MKPQLKVLKGARSGHTEVFSKSPIALGRHPASDLQFDPDHDLQVSARHALVVQRGMHWYIRDAGSRNGTYVNGHRITIDTKLDDTDQIRLGDTNGPVIEVRLVHDGTPAGITASAQPVPATEEPAVPIDRGEVRAPRPTAAGHQTEPESATHEPETARPSTTSERIRVEVGTQTRKLRALTLVAFVSFVGAATAFVVINQRQNTARRAEVLAIRARTDSLLSAADQVMRDLQGQVEGLEIRLRESRTAVSNLQDELDVAQASGSDAEVDELKLQLADATQGLAYQQAAARVDYSSLVAQNQLAVAMIWAKFADQTVQMGTAFAVRSNALLITNRHVVAGEGGTRRPIEIAVKFADSRQVWPARVLTLSNEVDLAVIQVDGIANEITTISGFGGRPQQGDPVAIIGFPLGSELPGASDTEIARTTFTAGSVSKILPDMIQFDGYGVQGASGSPIFDRNGNVIAVLYGGEPGSAGRIVYGVPSRYVVQLLNSLP